MKAGKRYEFGEVEILQFYHYFVLIHFYIGVCEEKPWFCKTSQISRKQGRNAEFEIDFITDYPYPKSSKVGMFEKMLRTKPQVIVETFNLSVSLLVSYLEIALGNRNGETYYLVLI